VEPTGLIVVDKAAGMTSHDVVARVRRLAGTRRVGHGGTLDPMATGVLIIGVGRATRLLTYVIGSDKEYTATIRLGQSTVTDDVEGEVVASVPADGVDEAAVHSGMAALTGEISQVPSAVSAIKVAGRRAYARVRAGEAVALPARRVRVARFDLLALRRAPGIVDLDVDVACSSGTYVRALARDLGAALDVGGHLTVLRRTRISAAGPPGAADAGPAGFTLAEALTLEQLAERDDPVTLPLAVAAARFFPGRAASAEQARALGHGGSLEPAGMVGPYAVFAPDGTVIAIAVERDGRARPEVVLTPSGPVA
jgi:tRNA pseudouridine55 synthase